MSTFDQHWNTFVTQQLISDLANLIISLVVGSNRATADLIIDTSGLIVDNINDGVSDVTGEIRDAERSILSAVETATEVSAAQTRETITHVTSPLSEGIERNAGLISGLSDGISGGLGDVVAGIGDLITGIGESLKVIIDNVVNIDGSLVTDVVEAVLSVIEEQQGEIVGVIEGLGDVFSGTIGEILNQNKDILEGVAEVGDDLADVLKEGVKATVGVSDAVSILSGDESIGDVFTRIIGSIADGSATTADDIKGQYQNLLNIPAGMEASLCSVFEQIMDDNEDQTAGQAWIKAIMFAVGAVMVPLSLTAQRMQVCLTNDSIDRPWAVMQPGDVVRALRFGLIDHNTAVDEIRRNGYDMGRSSHLISSSEEIAPLDILFSQWWRGIIDTSALDHELSALGYTDTRIDDLKKVSFFIPPVSDLVTMAVREVFSPEKAEESGLYNEFPEDFAEYAADQGVSEEWARRYWAAHWALPSVQMGYEMLHRGVITSEQLLGLMGALDIAPAWRQRLMDISYTPFTRVDIRRMYDTGILDDAGVVRAYKDIGYDDDKAQLQLEFVKALGSNDDAISLDVASDLTRSTILTFYKRGTIGREVALALLLQAGINAVAAGLFISNADLEIELQQRTDDIELVLDRFRIGVTSYQTAIDQLNVLGLPADEYELVRLELDKVRLGKVKVPSKADLDKFIGAGLINDNDYLEGLVNMGYSQEWASKYLTLAQG